MVQHSFLAIFHNSKIINPDNFHTLLLIILQKIGKGKLFNSTRGHYFPNRNFQFLISKFCFQIF